jgi:hypothetical protein
MHHRPCRQNTIAWRGKIAIPKLRGDFGELSMFMGCNGSVTSIPKIISYLSRRRILVEEFARGQLNKDPNDLGDGNRACRTQMPTQALRGKDRMPADAIGRNRPPAGGHGSI